MYEISLLTNVSALVDVFTNKTRVPGIYAEPAGQTIIPVEFHVRTMPTAIHRLHGGRHFGLLVKNTNKGRNMKYGRMKTRRCILSRPPPLLVFSPTRPAFRAFTRNPQDKPSYRSNFMSAQCLPPYIDCMAVGISVCW